ncbi:MAG: hypoxanthine phosphoribosyltransferase [Candidatus Saganbacteria bacterium]|nr:hypoxanthine phosphoribosyltransferase [Candidatus Saganbacteria bacterium]
MKILLDAKTIKDKIKELAKRISADYKGKDLILVGILKGAVVFLSDLMREIDIPVFVDLIQASSYGTSTTSSGVIKLVKDIELDIAGKDVLLVEDIIDYGYTLDHLLKYLSSKGPGSVKICVLFDKRERRKVEVPLDYKGFDVPDKFLVGYGLDQAEKYRNLPYVAVLEES